jgi:transcriptional regulator with PAS, ATPase and Fis domain
VKSKPAPTSVLVIAAGPEHRKILAGLVPRRFIIREVEPAELEIAADHVDVAGAVALLQGSTAEAGIKELEALRLLRAGRALVLVIQDVSDRLLELAISRLRPVDMVSYPPAAPHLREVLERVLPRENPGTGAIPGQRLATSLLGVSQSINGVIDQIRLVAGSRIPVLVLGETGTGKELVARALHQQSPRASGPFVAVNCSALPDTLLESELFGFERGAFTGAEQAKPGLFEQANGGTFFLDEIGDTSQALQVKLLRVLETKEVRRLGGSEIRNIDVRIVSATHHNMETAVEEGRFRQDLYFRLNTAPIYIPPLRRRRVDIPFLAQHFAEQFGEEHARRIPLDEAFLQALERQEFPGNVRELRNAVERAIALTEPGEALSARHLTDSSSSAAFYEPQAGSLKSAVERLEAQMIRDALARHSGNRTRAAEELGLSRLGLRQKMKRLDIEVPDR